MSLDKINPFFRIWKMLVKEYKLWGEGKKKKEKENYRPGLIKGINLVNN